MQILSESFQRINNQHPASYTFIKNLWIIIEWVRKLDKGKWIIKPCTLVALYLRCYNLLFRLPVFLWIWLLFLRNFLNNLSFNRLLLLLLLGLLLVLYDICVYIWLSWWYINDFQFSSIIFIWILLKIIFMVFLFCFFLYSFVCLIQSCLIFRSLFLNLNWSIYYLNILWFGYPLDLKDFFLSEWGKICCHGTFLWTCLTKMHNCLSLLDYKWFESYLTLPRSIKNIAHFIPTFTRLCWPLVRGWATLSIT